MKYNVELVSGKQTIEADSYTNDGVFIVFFNRKGDGNNTNVASFPNKDIKSVIMVK